jgi:hypothetical protein
MIALQLTLFDLGAAFANSSRDGAQFLGMFAQISQ